MSMAARLSNSFESGFFMPKGMSVLPDITLALASDSSRANGAKCEDACIGLPTMQYLACIATCKQTGKTPQEAFKFPNLLEFAKEARSVLVIVFGAILVILAIVLLTK